MSGRDVAFVAGATGYTGREVVRELRSRNVHTIAHVRPDSSSLETWRGRFSELGAETDTTQWDEEAMSARLLGLAPRFVFALLGTTRDRMQRDHSSYETVDYGLTVLLIQACRGLPAPPKFIYLSSLGAGPGARGAYLQTRHRVEEVLRGSGLPYLIARPSIITGEDREESRTGERVAARVADGLLSVAARLGGTGFRDRYRSTDARHLAQALVGFALDPKAVNRVLDSAELVTYGR